MTNVLVYSTSTCPWCHRAMDFLKEHNIKFTEVNVQEHPERANEVVEKSGQMGVPVIDIDGKIIVGFNENALRQALHIK